MVTRKEQAATSKALLVDCALRLFVSQGYAATSISQILAKADMAKGALYHHFPEGKKGLFLEVVDVVDHQLHEGFDEILATITSPIEQIEAGFDLLLRLASDQDFARIILIEASVVMPGAWADGSEFQLLKTALQMAMDASEIRTAPIDALAATLYGAARRGADYVARAEDSGAAANDTRQILQAILSSIRTD